MDIIINKILLSGLIMAIFVQLPGAQPRTESILPILNNKNELVLNESEAVKKALLELFKICRAERYSAAAKYVIYRGPEKNREWADVYNFNNSSERREIESTGKLIKLLLDQSDSYQFSRFSEKTQSEGRWYVWETIFKKKNKIGKVYFAFLKVKGHYALGDIDGHLAYIK